eukprot:4058_1
MTDTEDVDMMDPQQTDEDMDGEYEWEEVEESTPEVQETSPVPLEEENVAINENDLGDGDFADDADDDDWGDDGDGWGDDDCGDINNDDNIMSGAKSNQFEATIPEMTAQAINSNCDEINMIPLFAATPDLKSRSRIGAMVAIRVANLTNITTDQLEVWGLSSEYPFIALKFEFGPFYLNEAKVPKMQVGMCRKLSADEKLHPFRLSWTIEERVNNSMLTNKQWPPAGIDMKDIPQASCINELMESSAKEYAVCLRALRKYKKDVQLALAALLDEAQATQLAQSLPSVHSCQAQFGDIMNTISRVEEQEQSVEDEYKDVADATKISQLCEMYNIAYAAASLAFTVLGYDDAVDKLADPSVRVEYTTMAAADNDENENRKKKTGFLSSIFGSHRKDADEDKKESATDGIISSLQSMIRTHSGGGKVQSVSPQHFFRSIVMMNKHNFLLRCLCYGLKVLLNGNKYCMICDKELAFAGLKPTICDDRFCQWRHDQIGLGFSLSAEVLNRAHIVDLLLSMTYSASNAGRIQFFFPHGVRGLDPETENESFLQAANGSSEVDWTTFDAEKFANGDDPTQPSANVNKLKNVIEMCPAIEEMKPWAQQGDIVLKKELTKIHPLLYPLLVWIITSNRCHLRKLPDCDRISAIDTPYQFALCSATPDREKEFQELRAANGSFLAWHGSPMGNWHSILRMGLKNYSKTKHQSNGAAYGSGIYFGRNFNLSWGYCRPGTNPGWKNSQFGVSLSCMALCEICYHKDDAKHHRGKRDIYMKTNKTNTNKTKSTSSDWTKTTNKTNRWVKTSGIYVVDQEECVMTRFFLIFPKTTGYKQLEANSLMGSLPNVVRAFK